MRRLKYKLNLVEQRAELLARGMLKGTLKYDRDELSVDEWLEFLGDDATDTINYIDLLKDARRKERGE